MSQPTQSPLGRATDCPRSYSPQSLFAVPRADSRAVLNVGAPLPFHGEDLWNAWELCWLDSRGRPQVAVAEIRVPASSPNIIESKSLKLYLNSLALTRYPSGERLRDTIATDLGACAKAKVTVLLCGVSDATRHAIVALPGSCIDDCEANFDTPCVDGRILRADDTTRVSELLHSNLLRSNCPVTHQPDTGTVLIRYRGPKIDRGTLLEYLVSFRTLDEFHETCVERIFVDLKSSCAPDQLTVYARYNRRGGIDINPFRSDFEQRPDNSRLWRQ
jgi:7-cyano-7-deazaguanine reductase